MDIIFHGKPTTHSIYAKEGINPSLKDKITNVFFESRGGIPNEKGLVVETYFWQQHWYSVYTFSITKLKDSANRPNSYFSISLVFQDAYNLLTSYVYNYLLDIYYQFIDSKLISKEGKYLIKDFETKDFTPIESYINDNFVNLQDPLNESFVTKRSNQEIRYSLQDCDALTFIQDLQKNGRIIIGEGDDFPQKCAASVISAKDAEIKKLSTTLQEQNGQINQLQTNLSSAQENASKNAKTVEKELNKFKDENNSLKQQLSDKQSEFNELVERIRASLPNTHTQKLVLDEKPIDEDNRMKKYFRFLPLANLVLIVVCICLLLLKNGTPVQPDSTIKKLKSQVAQLEADNKAKERELKQLQETNLQQARTLSQLEVEKEAYQSQTITTVATTIEAQPHAKDIDCNVIIATSTGYTPIRNGSEISDGDELIIRWTPRANYSWYAYNLHQDSQKKLKEAAGKGEVAVPIKYVKSKPDSKSEVIITYRSKDKNNLCEDNRIILKIKK